MALLKYRDGSYTTRARLIIRKKAPLYELSSYWNDMTACWLLAVGCWLLADAHRLLNRAVDLTLGNTLTTNSQSLDRPRTFLSCKKTEIGLLVYFGSFLFQPQVMLRQ
jgi:hypothetical protein